MNDITFLKQNGGLSRPLPGEDHISGLVFYGVKPAEWGAADVREITDIETAETLGITSDAIGDAAIWHYHLSEFFAQNPGAKLYVGIFAVPAIPGTPAFTEVTTMQAFADGKIRQVGVFYTEAAFASTMVTALQLVLVANETNHMPLTAILAPDVKAVADLTTLPDLKALTGSKVSVLIGQDGNNIGKGLYTTSGASVGCVGACLGALSRASVHENIGWVANFNMSHVELDVPAFGNGKLYKELSSTAITGIHDKGYMFLRKHVGLSGTFFNDTYTAIAATSDYCNQESNRTMDKAMRNVRTYLLPQLNGPVEIDATTGKLAAETVKYFEEIGNTALDQMKRVGELSGFKVVINPAQDILSSSELQISIVNVPKGVIRNMKVKIGFAKSV